MSMSCAMRLMCVVMASNAVMSKCMQEHGTVLCSFVEM